jgi:hypothetical protein
MASRLFETIESARRTAYEQPPVRADDTLRLVRLVAGGDSWFSYFPPPDVLDGLRTSRWPGRHYEIHARARPGALVNDMVYGGRDLLELFELLEQRRPDAVLLSGGGNDVAGEELFCMLHHRASGAAADVEPRVLEGLVHGILAEAYRDWIDAIRAKASHLGLGVIPILVHGYDYAIPDGRGWAGGLGPLPGPWLDPSLTRKGFDRVADDARRRAVIRVLINAFNGMLVELCASRTNVHHVDVRNTLQTGDWANELHPTRLGFLKIAARFDATLRTAVP